MNGGGWARRRAAAAVGLLLAAAVLVAPGCGGSPAPASAPATPRATSSAGGRVVAPAGWGLQFTVPGSLPQTIGPLKRGSGATIIFESAQSAAGGGLTVVARQPLAQAFATKTTIAHLNDTATVKGFLPAGEGAGADIVLVRRATRSTVGKGWPAVTARYAVTLASSKAPLYGQRTFGLEMVMFWHAGYVYEVMLLVSPRDQFAGHRAELESTPQTIADAQ